MLSTVYVTLNGRLLSVDVGSLITSILPGIEHRIIACPLQQWLRERPHSVKLHAQCLSCVGTMKIKNSLSCRINRKSGRRYSFSDFANTLMYSVIPLIRMLVIRLTIYSDRHGFSGKSVGNFTKLTCLEITGYRIK
jgi:hypothetical protein